MMLARLVQSSKESTIIVTLLGIVMLVRLVQPSNVPIAIAVTGSPLYDFGITTFVSAQVPIPIT